MAVSQAVEGNLWHGHPARGETPGPGYVTWRLWPALNVWEHQRVIRGLPESKCHAYLKLLAAAITQRLHYDIGQTDVTATGLRLWCLEAKTVRSGFLDRLADLSDFGVEIHVAPPKGPRSRLASCQ